MADEIKTGAPVTDEIAGVKKDIFQGWIGGIIQNPDKVLKSESGGKGFDLYEGIALDPQVRSCFQTRKLAVIGREWEVLPASARRQDKEIAEFVKEILLRFDFDSARMVLLDAVLMGFKVAEVMWEVQGAQVRVKGLIGRHSRRFVFALDGSLRLLTPQNLIDGEAVPERKFQVFSWGSSNGSPYGCGLGNTLYWPVWFKKHGIKFWVVFAEKFGSPTVLGKYPVGTLKDQQDILLEVLAAFQQESAVKMPDTMQVELLEAQRQGAVNTYETLCNYMNAEIAKVILGQTLTTEIGAAGGAYLAALVHEGVRQDYVKADTDEDVLRERRFWRYVAVLDSRTRPEHAAWHDTVLPADDPWWDTHYPPNGWGCRCAVVSLSETEIERDGLEKSKRPDGGTYEWTNPATGEVENIPKGIDPGWAYNPGETTWGRNEALRLMEDKGPWTDLNPWGPSAYGLKAVKVEEPRARSGTRAHGEKKLRKALRDAIGGDEAAFTDPAGDKTLVTQAVVDHILSDPKRLDGREQYFPFIKELIEAPEEIWMGFAVSEVSGRVGVRKKYVKAIRLEKDTALGLYAETRNGLWVGGGFFRGDLSGLRNLRKGRLLWKR